MREVEQLVLDTLQERTKDNPLTRQELKTLTQEKDSNARRVIQALRSQGYRIASSASNAGYWIATTESEYRAFVAEYASKAYTILGIVRAMDEHIEGQQSINGV